MSVYPWTVVNLFKSASTIKIQPSGLVEYKANIITSPNVTCSRHDIAEILLMWLMTTVTHSITVFLKKNILLIETLVTMCDKIIISNVWHHEGRVPESQDI